MFDAMDTLFSSFAIYHLRGLEMAPTQYEVDQNDYLGGVCESATRVNENKQKTKIAGRKFNLIHKVEKQIQICVYLARMKLFYHSQIWTQNLFGVFPSFEIEHLHRIFIMHIWQWC